MTIKKTAVLYHNDADGYALALAAWLVYGDNANYIPVRYGEPVPAAGDRPPQNRPGRTGQGTVCPVRYEPCQLRAGVVLFSPR